MLPAIDVAQADSVPDPYLPTALHPARITGQRRNDKAVYPRRPDRLPLTDLASRTRRAPPISLRSGRQCVSYSLTVPGDDPEISAGRCVGFSAPGVVRAPQDAFRGYRY